MGRGHGLAAEAGEGDLRQKEGHDAPLVGLVVSRCARSRQTQKKERPTRTPTYARMRMKRLDLEGGLLRRPGLDGLQQGVVGEVAVALR